MRGDDGVSVDGFVDVESLIWREARSGELLPEHAHTPGDPEDRTDVRVALPRAIAPGERATFDVRFRTQLPPIVLRAGYAGSFNMVAQWFPQAREAGRRRPFCAFSVRALRRVLLDYGDYDVTIQVPEGFEVGATGALVSDDRSEIAGRCASPRARSATSPSRRGMASRRPRATRTVWPSDVCSREAKRARRPFSSTLRPRGSPSTTASSVPTRIPT
jgi:hypothetical protein